MTPTTVGFFRELRHGDRNGQSLREVVGGLAEDKRQAVARYLQAATALAATPGWVGDVLDPSKTNIGSSDLMTDGSWIWPLDLAYYVLRYGVGLPEPFLRHMESLYWQPPELSSAQLHELTEAVLRPGYTLD